MLLVEYFWRSLGLKFTLLKKIYLKSGKFSCSNLRVKKCLLVHLAANQNQIKEFFPTFTPAACKTLWTSINLPLTHCLNPSGVFCQKDNRNSRRAGSPEPRVELKRNWASEWNWEKIGCWEREMSRLSGWRQNSKPISQLTSRVITRLKYILVIIFRPSY